MTAKTTILSGPPEAQAIEWLSRKMAAEGFLTIPQVGNGVGANYRRTIDALLIQTWPSRTLQIIGVEYKRFRSDWLRELKDGAKAESIAKHCDRFLVLAPKGMIPIGEVPNGWGLWEIGSGKLWRTKAPPSLSRGPAPLSLSFLAAVLRAAEKHNRRDAVLESDRDELHKRHQESVEAEVKRRTRRYQELKDRVEQFELESGLAIADGWGLQRLSEGVRKYLDSPDRFRDNIIHERRSLKAILKTIDAALGADHDEKIEG